MSDKKPTIMTSAGTRLTVISVTEEDEPVLLSDYWMYLHRPKIQTIQILVTSSDSHDVIINGTHKSKSDEVILSSISDPHSSRNTPLTFSQFFRRNNHILPAPETDVRLIACAYLLARRACGIERPEDETLTRRLIASPISSAELLSLQTPAVLEAQHLSCDLFASVDQDSAPVSHACKMADRHLAAYGDELPPGLARVGYHFVLPVNHPTGSGPPLHIKCTLGLAGWGAQLTDYADNSGLLYAPDGQPYCNFMSIRTNAQAAQMAATLAAYRASH